MIQFLTLELSAPSLSQVLQMQEMKEANPLSLLEFLLLPIQLMVLRKVRADRQHCPMPRISVLVPALQLSLKSLMGFNGLENRTWALRPISHSLIIRGWLSAILQTFSLKMSTILTCKDVYEFPQEPFWMSLSSNTSFMYILCCLSSMRVTSGKCTVTKALALLHRRRCLS